MSFSYSGSFDHFIILTTFTCPTEYSKIMVNTVIARRRAKLWAKSQ